MGGGSEVFVICSRPIQPQGDRRRDDDTVLREDGSSSSAVCDRKSLCRDMEVIGFDFYNQCYTGNVSMTLRRDKADSDHIPCVLIIETGKNDAEQRCKK